MAERTHMLSLFKNILILFCLSLAQTGCEWVEISQNHYRKEPPTQETLHISHEETTEAIIVYRNTSLLDKHWKKGVIDRVPSVSNIRRVHVPSVKTPSKQMENNILIEKASIHINAPDESYDSVITKPKILSKYHDGTIPIKSSEKIPVPYHINRGSGFERNSESISYHKDHTASTNILSRVESVNKGYITHVKKENLNPDIEGVTAIYLKSYENKGSTQRTTQIEYQDESKVDFKYEGQTRVINEQAAQPLPINNPMIEKTESFIKRTEINSNGKTSEMNTPHFKNQIESDKNNKTIVYEINDKARIINSDAISNNTKGSTMNIMLNLIKVVTDSIYKNSRKSFKSKINYLEGLKSNILSTIEDQVERIWPEDNARSFRRVRDATGRGHVEFPSSESALMSISFLTFAVFLIKLVLQVIHTYKNKTMMVTPAVVTAVGRAAAAIKSNYQ